MKIDASSFSLVCVALSGQKQSDLARSSSSKRPREKFGAERGEDPDDDVVLSFRTTSLDKPVKRVSSQPLHTPETKNRTGTPLPTSSMAAVASNGECVGDTELFSSLHRIVDFSFVEGLTTVIVYCCSNSQHSTISRAFDATQLAVVELDFTVTVTGFNPVSEAFKLEKEA